MTPKQRCDQCPNEGECLRESADDCALGTDPVHARREGSRLRSFFGDLAMTQEHIDPDLEDLELVWD